MSMYLTLGVNILASTTEIQLLLPSKCTFDETVCSAKAPMYLHISLVLFTAFYMHVIYPSVDSEVIYS